MNRLLPLALLVSSSIFGCGGEEARFQVPFGAEPAHGHEGHDEPAPDFDAPVAASLQGIQMELGAGVAGNVWVLDTYSGGGSHPGVNATDIGAAAGTRVWHQMGSIPSSVSGGWIYVQHIQSPGYCSQYNPGDTYYNGAKLRVWTLFYGDQGEVQGHHWAAYQHVEPFAEVLGGWFRWNNVGAERPLWAEPDVAMANGAEGGLNVGTLFDGEGRHITNGPGGGLCHLGNHLHQESVGWRSPDVGLYSDVAERSTRTHLLIAYDGLPNGIAPPYAPGPASGEPGDAPTPGEPTPEEPTPEEPAPEEPAPTDPPEASCACVAGSDNFCHLPPSTPGCPMTAPGGYCDPNGDGGYDDADWVKGWQEHDAQCN